MYSNNIFTQIISGEIPAKKLYEDEKLIVINDINPAASVHLLVIPKSNYKDFTDFVENAEDIEIVHYFKILSRIAKKYGVDEYRIVSNIGESAGQSVFHFHTHILSGLDKGNLINKNL